MSEYQYYEFQAVDRPLSAADQEALRAISTRARITAASFINHYEWGDLKASPGAMMERWFDLQVYMGFWSVRTLMIRLPRRLFDLEAAWPYAADWTLDVATKGESIILSFQAEDLDIDSEDDGSGWMAALAPLRAQLMEGDLRCLYLGWLLAVQNGDVDDDEEEAPRPPGLSRLGGSLKAFADFFQLDKSLLDAAMEGNDPGLDPLTDAALDAFVQALPPEEKDTLLCRLARGEGAVLTGELRRRCRKALTGSRRAEPTLPARRVGDLRAAAVIKAKEWERFAAEQAAAEQARREQAEAEARAQRVDALARRGESAWREVDTLIEAMNARDYDQAISLLLDLKALAARDDSMASFQSRTAKLYARDCSRGWLSARCEAGAPRIGGWATVRCCVAGPDMCQQRDDGSAALSPE